MGSLSYLSFFYFGISILGALVGTYIKFPPLLLILPIMFYKRPRFAMFIFLFILANILTVPNVDLKDTEFVGSVKAVNSGSSVLNLSYFDGKNWKKLNFDVNIYSEEPLGTIVYAKGELRKTTSHPRYYIKPTFYATTTDYNSFINKTYLQFDSFRSFANAIDPFYQNLFGKSARDDDFVKSGLYHIFCVSGMHVSLLYIFSLSLAGLFTYKKIPKILIALIFPTIFVIGSGMNIPSIRALLMIYLWTLLRVLDIKINPINLVSLVGIAMVLSEPGIALSLSFYMTFFATLGVFASTNNITANIGGFLGSSPFVALIGSVNPFSIIATMLVSFPVEIVMFGLTAAYIFYSIKLYAISSLILYGLQPFSWFTKAVAHIFSKLPSLPNHFIISLAFAATFAIYLMWSEHAKSNVEDNALTSL
ncbi:MAG TPA: ComEC/Rec2 family competence protein [Fervidobacterium sp.]|nr:ComEC/Rec2 family competence protein [Fervidobacterium sp.]HRD20976.1 ComEC/Rec2 family competence protein [Fervidobacterium sp.]